MGVAVCHHHPRPLVSWLVLVQAQAVASVVVAVLYIVRASNVLITPWLMGCLGGGGGFRVFCLSVPRAAPLWVVVALGLCADAYVIKSWNLLSTSCYQT